MEAEEEEVVRGAGGKVEKKFERRKLGSVERRINFS